MYEPVPEFRNYAANHLPCWRDTIDCVPIQVWLVSRHGTRYPSREKIEKLKKLNDFKTMITAESTLCAEDVAAIENWNFNLTKSDDNMLQKQGVEELKSLAVRLKRQFPQVFNTPYNDAKFKVRTYPEISRYTNYCNITDLGMAR